MGRDGLTGLAILGASLALLGATLGLERHPMVPVGPAFYPRIVLGVTAVLALLLVAADVLERRRGPARRPAGERANAVLVVAAFGLFAAYVAALPWLGFRVSTLAFLVAMPVLLERPATRARWVAVAVVAVAGTAATYLVFEHSLHVLLPRGRWTGF